MNTNIHYILFVAVLFIALFYTLRPTLKRKKHVVEIITVVLTAFSGLRSWWMGDLIKYYTLYRSCNGTDWQTAVVGKWTNMGIRVFFRLMGAVGVSYDVCIFIIAAFAAISLGVLVYRYSTSPFVSYLMYIGMGFYLFTFSGLKQTIAMGFLCFAMMSLLERKLPLFLLWTAVAGFFHAPALVFLLAYPFAHKKVDRLYLLFIAAMLGLVFLFRDRLVSVLSELYQDDADAFGEAKELIGGRFLMMVLILVGGYYLRPVRRSDVTYAKVYNVMVLAAMFQTFSVYNNVFSRLTDYFYQFIVIFLPMALRPRGGLPSAQVQMESPGYYRHRDIYTIAVIGITAYTAYYYWDYIAGSYNILKDFWFFWQMNPYSLYGA